MEFLVATNDPVRCSFLLLLLRDAGFRPVLYDTHMAAAEGSISAIRQRIAVPAEQAPAARRFLQEAGELY
jgi:hypothetical protein